MSKAEATARRTRTSANEVDCCFNALKGSRAVGTRYDVRAYVFRGTVTLAAIRLWFPC